MKQFRFNLENVLKFRESKERLAQQKVREVHSELRLVEGNIQRLEEEGDELHRTLPGRVSGTVSADDMRAYFEYYQALGANIAMQQDEAFRVSNVLAEKREDLRGTQREKKAIERLKERRFEEWRVELDRKESLFLDELAVLRYGKSDMNNPQS